MRFGPILTALTVLAVPAIASGQELSGVDEPAGQTGDVLRRTAPQDDPYGPLGRRAGNFVLLPSLTSTLRGTTNASLTAGGAGSVSKTIEAELMARSDWARHAATVTLRGSYETFLDGTDADDPEASIDIAGRIDFSDQWQGDIGGSYRYSQQAATDPDFPAGLDGRPGVHELAASAALSGGAGRIRLTLAGSIDRIMYEDGTSGGAPVDQGDRTNTRARARLRLGIQATPSLTPFVEAEVSRRLYDQVVDNDGLRRGEFGQVYRAGLAFDRPPVLSGELAFGARRTDFDDATLPSLSSLTVDASLIWSPGVLTTVTASAATSLSPSTDPLSSGSITHEGSAELAYAWKPNLTLNWDAGFSHRKFQGTGQIDIGANVGVEAVWRVNRGVRLAAGYAHEWSESTGSGGSAEADIVQLEMRLQR